jgi:hypothetical protein
MKQIPLKVIDKPGAEDRRSIIKGPSERPYFHGMGDINFVCGCCGFVLAAGMRPEQLKAIVFCCPVCGRHNELEPKVV